MKLTKKEAIRRHRLMWNWIADETLRRYELVKKEEAFEHFGWKPVYAMCWCCEYDRTHKKSYCVNNCIVQWPGISCVIEDVIESEGGSVYEFGIFREWMCEKDPKKYAELARKIANLTERKGV